MKMIEEKGIMADWTQRSWEDFIEEK